VSSGRNSFKFFPKSLRISLFYQRLSGWRCREQAGEVFLFGVAAQGVVRLPRPGLRAQRFDRVCPS
jgi:hypothetical protein